MTHPNAIESYLFDYLSRVRPIWLVAGCWSGILSIIGFFIMALDKDGAQHGKWRFSEKLLLKISYAGGCWGVFGGMILFDHKTAKPLFMGLELGALLMWYFIFADLNHILGPPFPGG